MAVDVYTELKLLLTQLFTSHDAAVEYTESPVDTLVAEGITDSPELAQVDLNALVAETASEVGVSAETQQALANPSAGSPFGPPVSDGPLTLEHAVQHLNYVTYATYQGDEEIFQNISNQEFSFVNDQSTNIEDFISAGGDVAVAEGDGAVAAGGDAEDVITGDDNQLVDGDGNAVAGGDQEGVAVGENAVAAGENLVAEGGVLVEGANSGQINTGDGEVAQAGDDLNQLDEGSVLVDGDAGAINTGEGILAGGDAVQAGGDAVQTGGGDFNVLGEGAVQAGEDANAVTGDGNTANQIADSDLEGVAFGESSQASNIESDLSGASITDSGIAIGEDSSATSADLNNVSVQDGALEVGDGFADNLSNTDVDEGSALNFGGGSAQAADDGAAVTESGDATGSNTDVEIDESILASDGAAQAEGDATGGVAPDVDLVNSLNEDTILNSSDAQQNELEIQDEESGDQLDDVVAG
jgi:hypothetical protein